MQRTRIKLEVLIDLDPIPGANHTKEDARDWLQAMLLSSVGHYDPIVLIADE